MDVRISAVVCTHNRASYLRKALGSLASQTLPHELYEIIVVDNASTDGTREVADEFADVPGLHYLYEPVLGSSRSRNRGWRGAQGEYIAYLDDDAVASPEWLEKLLDVFDSFEPTPGCVGGKVEAIWEVPRPDWLHDGLLGRLSIFDWSDVPVVVGEQEWLSGCNIAFPREVLRALGGFREDLGREGTSLRGNDDIDMRHRLDSLGRRCVYHPEIVVDHHASAERLTKRWFRQAAYWQGISTAIMLHSESGRRPPLGVRARLTLGMIGWALPRLALMLVATNPAARFRRQCQVLEAVGQISGLWRRTV